MSKQRFVSTGITIPSFGDSEMSQMNSLFPLSQALLPFQFQAQPICGAQAGAEAIALSFVLDVPLKWKATFPNQALHHPWVPEGSYL